MWRYAKQRIKICDWTEGCILKLDGCVYDKDDVDKYDNTMIVEVCEKTVKTSDRGEWQIIDVERMLSKYYQYSIVRRYGRYEIMLMYNDEGKTYWK